MPNRTLLRYFRFFVGCALLFGSGYFYAKPRGTAGEVFAPVIAIFALIGLWRLSLKPDDPTEGWILPASSKRMAMFWIGTAACGLLLWLAVR